MAYKNKKNREGKKQELPSFLFQSNEVPENVTFGQKTVKNGKLGPVFFGCYEYQPMFHSLNLGLSFDVHKTASSKENLLRHAFRPLNPTRVWTEEKQVVTGSCKKTQALFPDPYLHRCPGQRKVFVPEPPREIDLGETISTIEGEASQEIPLYCIQESLDGEQEENYKILFLSDFWEKRRMYMSSNVRMAHTHFPKQFVTLQVIGPTIPASIIIKKLPTKRKTDSQLDLALKPKAKTKKEMKEDEAKTKKPLESAEEKVDALPAPAELTKLTETAIKSEDEAKEGSDHEELHDESGMIEEEEDAKDEEDDVNEVGDEVLAE